MRCMLHAVDLGPKYWSVVLIHVVYVKNILSHGAINKTPYEAITGKQLDLSNLQKFDTASLQRNLESDQQSLTTSR